MEIDGKKFTTVSNPPKIGSYKSYKIDIPTTYFKNGITSFRHVT